MKKPSPGLIQLIERLGGKSTGDSKKDVAIAKKLMSATGRICYQDAIR